MKDLFSSTLERSVLEGIVKAGTKSEVVCEKLGFDVADLDVLRSLLTGEKPSGACALISKLESNPDCEFIVDMVKKLAGGDLLG